MSPRNNPWQSYRKVATQTASQGQLVLMLYEGAIGFLEKALAGFGHSDPLQFNLTINNNIIRAQAIIHEMNGRLDMDKGGEISENFRRLYNYYYRRLQQGNMRKQKEPIEEILQCLRELRDSWAQMLRQSNGAPANAEPALASLQAA